MPDMLSHAVLAFYRSLMRHKLYAALNVLGLATGIAVFLVLALVAQYESRYNCWLPDAPDIDRLDQTWSLPGRVPQEYADTPFVALRFLLADFPQIQAGTRLPDRGTPVRAGRIVDQEIVSYVDRDFFKVLALPMMLGDRDSSLAAPASAVITQSVARNGLLPSPACSRTFRSTQPSGSRS